MQKSFPQDLLQLIETANAPIFGIDLEGRVNEWNHKAATITGFAKDEVLGRDLVADFITDDYKASVKEVLDKALKGDETSNYEFPLNTKLGDRVYVLLNSTTCRDAHGTITGVIGIGQDVTGLLQKSRELFESEKQIHLLMDALPTLISYVDKEHRYRFNNKVYEDWFGHRREDIQDRYVKDVLGDDAYAALRDYFDRTLAGETVNFESKVPYRDGGERYVNATYVPDFGEDGSVEGFYVLVEDITERKESEKILREKEEILRQSQKMEAVGQLTGGVAHDFNNLLAVIYGNLELVLDSGGLDDGSRKNLYRAMAAVDKGVNLTDQLLTFSRQQILNPQTVPLNNLLLDTISLLQRTLGEDLDIKTAFDTNIPMINVDTGLLWNAIINLANNARDAMPKGGMLTIKTARVDLDGEFKNEEKISLTGPHVLISVSDSGEGIKKKDLEQVFEPFFTTKDIGKGSGLGLSMVHGFVKQSGGHVRIDSKRGKGTTVNLYFPAAGSMDAERKEERTPSPKAEAKGVETILVVEDDENVRQVTASMLVRLGYKVLEAENGPSALKLLGKNGGGVDLVFSDVIMPSGISGYELAHELRNHYRDIRILLTSGYPDKVINKDGLDGSGINLLRKPYKKVQLANAVRIALDQ
ncbi:MAG: PAS domain S-box protein [Rhodospirillales bacterium]|nr:PAS domain S-box protein [Rhodospirillales bacterium]